MFYWFSKSFKLIYINTNTNLNFGNICSKIALIARFSLLVDERAYLITRISKSCFWELRLWV